MDESPRRQHASTPRGGRLDVHHHVVPPVYRQALRARGIDHIGGRLLPEWNEDRAFTLMAESDIACAVASISSPGVWFEDDPGDQALARDCNEFHAELIRRHPGTFGGLGSLPLPNLDASLEELEYALDVLQLDGLILMTSYPSDYLGDARFEPLYQELDRRTATVLIHPTVPRVLPDLPIYPFTLEFVLETSRAAVNLVYQGVTERYPRIRFILSHGGGVVPYLSARLERGWSSSAQAIEAAPLGALHYLRRMYFDTALSVAPETLRCMLDFAGPDQTVFGSDFPFAAEPAVLDQANRLDHFLAGQETRTRDAVERGNAQRLFPRLAGRMRGTGSHTTDDIAGSAAGFGSAASSAPTEAS